MADRINCDMTKSIIIPVYNEELRIGQTLLDLVFDFAGQEIITICDGQDNSREIIKDLSIKYPNIKILSSNRRLGKGGALVRGFKAASGQEIGFVDADDSVSAGDLKRMFLELNNADGVIASRRLKESKILVKQPLMRRSASQAFNIFVRTIMRLPFTDTQCGAKVFKREAILSIVDEIETTGFEIDVEILWRLKRKGYTVIEYPITWKHSEGSKFKLSYSIGMLVSLLKIKFIK